jgi:GMP synthase (glutamine-hydrolysing)
VPAPRILVVDGNVAELRARQRAMLGYDTGGGYAQALKRLMPDLLCDIVRPADANPVLPPGVALESYDGAAITGSALNIYHGGEPVARQVEFAKAIFAAGVPLFGSCWGLQVAVTAAGGEVRANPRGREFGFARRIQLTEAGRSHPLFAGKPAVFEAPTVHKDEIASLPDGAVALACNDMGLQAAAFSCGRGTFWGVQYHPEYDYLDIAALARRYGEILVKEGMFADGAALEAFAAELAQLQHRPDDAALLWKYGLGPAVADERLRVAELRNWLNHEVVPRSARRR